MSECQIILSSDSISNKKKGGFDNIQKNLAEDYYLPDCRAETLNNFASEKTSKQLELWNS